MFAGAARGARTLRQSPQAMGEVPDGRAGQAMARAAQMTAWIATIAALPLGVWLYLLAGRGGFWRAARPLDGPFEAPADWPPVAAIVPARDEAQTIGQAIGSVLEQDYPGPLSVVLVDDHSADGTASVAAAAAASSTHGARLTIVTARHLPPGWTGKLWALSEGVAAAEAGSPAPVHLWFTDADIVHDPRVLRRLVAQAETDDRDLVSLMVALTCEAVWERLLIPTFVFFFAMLYPFAWVNDPRRRTAGAAGGCLMVRREALARAGGLATVRGALIDDCALAARIKRHGRPGGGRLWLALTGLSRSVRPYPALADIWRMVARSAYTQLRHSPTLLAGTLLGMALAYLAPPLLALAYPLHGQPAAAVLGGLAWVLMAALIAPTLRLYRQRPAMGFALPVAALFYAAMTIDSARRHALGQGGLWKGRVHRPAHGDTSGPAI